MAKSTNRIAAFAGIAILCMALPVSPATGAVRPNDLGAMAFQEADAASIELKNEQQGMIKITIGSRVFTATLNNRPAADALRSMLPLTLDMQDLNGNEKFHQLDTGLPTSDHQPGTIQTGDLMLWSGNTLVLFYRTFKTGYPYTRIGRIDDPKGLAEAVGKGKVTVRFEAM